MRSPARYTGLPLPPYRFVPGRTPHPYRDPAGYAYGQRGEHASAIRLAPPERWSENVEYLFGCDLYNQGYWWEAHEAWEGLWRSANANTTQRRFLQALILATVCHLKLEMGVLAAVQRLRARANRRLLQVAKDIAGDTFMGIRVWPWYETLREYYQRILAPGTEGPAHDPANYPYIWLTGICSGLRPAGTELA